MMSSSVTIRFSGRGIGSRGTAAVVLAVLVSCRGSLGTRDASAQMPSDPRPRPLVDTSDAGRPRIRVELDVFHGKASEKARAVRVAHLMEDVMNSEEFRCAVLSFDFRRPPWVANAPLPCSQDSSRNTVDGHGNGFRGQSYCQPVPCGSQTPELNSAGQSFVPAADVWNIVAAGRELANVDEAGRPIIRSEPGVLDLNIGIEGNFHSSIGTTDQCKGTTLTRSNIFNSYTDYQLAGHWLHEYTHRVGFCDRDQTGYSRTLVSYAIGYLACVEAGRLSGATDYVSVCEATVHGNGRD